MESKNERVTKKKWNELIIIIVFLIVIILGLIFYICYDKGILFSSKEPSSNTSEKAKNNTEDTSETIDKETDTTKNNDVFVNDNIHVYYYETIQEENDKYILALINTGNNSGYFSLRYVSVNENGSESPSTNGYYSIKDNKLTLSIGPYTNDNNTNNTNADFIFKNA